MILSKSELNDYLSKDRISLGIKGTAREFLFNDIWWFQKTLRYAEYWTNCSETPFGKLISVYFRLRLRRRGRKLGFSIPINVFGPGLSIAHAGTIVVNSHCKIGANCRIHVCVNMGSAPNDSEAAPVLGDDCYVGPGAKLYGGIIIGDNTAIGANSVVNKSFPDGNVTIVGAPARTISDKGPLDFRSFSIKSAL